MSPVDSLSFFDVPGMFDEADVVHVSVSFTWDINYAEYLAEQWKHVAPVEMGGPAFGKPSAEFVPGRYVRKGAVITSRGCRNHCWFCSVWRREPALIELPITEGINVLDDNLLACSEKHIREVFQMLKRQKGQVEFTGGLEAAILKDWHVDLLADIKPWQMFFAYDTPEDEEPLLVAGRKLKAVGFYRKQMRCYVLIGYRGDTMEKAEKRLMQTVNFGFYPMAMLWKNEQGVSTPEWRLFQRQWVRPAIISSRLKAAA
jgi:hypothetical protein